MKKEELYEACLSKWGAEAQMLMAIEEMGELSQALSRCLNGRKHNVEEEIADVLLMVGQIEHLFDKEKIKKIQKKKLKRIQKRLGTKEKI